MGTSKGKGGRNRHKGKNGAIEKRELSLKQDGQEYAQVLRMLGNGRLEALCIDGKTRLCHIRGKMRKKVWVNVGDVILLGLRDFQDDKADVIIKYSTDEARLLKNEKELPDHVRINNIDSIHTQHQEDNDLVDFVDDSDDSRQTHSSSSE